MSLDPDDFGIGPAFWRIQEAIVVADVHTGRILLWNAAAERRFGYTVNEALDLDLDRLVTDGLRERDRAGIRRYLETAYGEIVDRGMMLEVLARRRSGEEIAVELNLSDVSGPPGGGPYVMALIRDATERRGIYDAQAATERARRRIERLQEIVTLIPAIVGVLTGPEHRIQFLNPAARAMLGPRAVTGMALREAAPELAAQGLIATLDSVFERGEPFAAQEALLQLDPEGSGALRDGYFTFIAQPLRDRAGTVGGILIHATEVTDQVLARARAERLAADNSRLYNEAQSAMRTRDSFLAAITHDLRTPLTGIKGYAQMIARLAAEPGGISLARLETLLGHIDASTTQATAFLRQLDDVAYIQAGRPLELVRRPTDLVQLVRQEANVLQQTNNQRRVRVKATTAEIVGLWDAFRLQRVVLNLLTNAMKYSPSDREITVTVGADAEPGWARLVVRDQGVGISAEDLPHVFESFYRSPDVVGQVSGSGLGLASVKQVVEQHGGEVQIESAPGSGTTVTVRLPLE